ncbi:hypothetical protein [Limimaricola cinnabarinus]|uniref:hypothetical protein n=1 Tax=Limimaricola cinnabarinus TaxID=1125964 RepID=UPI0039E4C246
MNLVEEDRQARGSGNMALHASISHLARFTRHQYHPSAVEGKAANLPPCRGDAIMLADLSNRVAARTA